MKAVWSIGAWVLGIALFGFAVERIGSGRVRGELEAMSSAIVVIFALSLIRLYLQTQSWSLALKQDGILVYFAAFKKHIGLYPPVRGDAKLEKAIARYAGPKGNLQFPLDEPMPIDLIERIVKLRVKQDSEKAAARRKKSPTSRKARESR